MPGALKRRGLTLYHIRRHLDEVLVTDFSQILQDANELDEFHLISQLNFDTRLFVSYSELSVPQWVPFLEDGFGNLEIDTHEAASAVLLVRVHYYVDQYFACTFGQGRHLLKPDAIDRGYGLRVALNVIYETVDEDSEPSRIRSVTSRTVAANTIRTRRQADHRAAFETFGIDIQRDLLGAVTGMPIDSHYWGARISGADSLSVQPKLRFDGLGDFCVEVARKHRSKDYQTDFKWIDKLHAVTAPDVIADLNEEVFAAILADTGDVSVTVPELVQWDEIGDFRYSFAPHTTFRAPEDSNLLEVLESAELLDKVDGNHLKQWKVEALDGDGNLMAKWPLYQCLTGQFGDGDQVVVFTNGLFFGIEAGYHAALETYIDALPESKYPLPDGLGDIYEGVYNKAAADCDPSFLLLDKKTVRVGGFTTAIEICDVLTDDRAFIHVKRKLGSSSLSHLFAQGLVSADLFLMNAQYRLDTQAKVLEAENERASRTGDPGFVGRFSGFDPGRISPGDFKVVYAIIARWNGKTAAQALPFFSQVNLRRHVDDLRRMGYGVEFARIETGAV